MSKFINPTKVITGPNTSFSYANVWEAKSINGGAPKFSVSLIIPKSDTKTVEKIKAAIEAAYKEGESKLKGNGRSVPALSAIKNPLRDGDTERPDDEAYANSYFINANSSAAPGIVDANCKRQRKSHVCRPYHRAPPRLRVKILAVWQPKMFRQADPLKTRIKCPFSDRIFRQCRQDFGGDFFALCKVVHHNITAVYGNSEKQYLKSRRFYISVHTAF